MDNYRFYLPARVCCFESSEWDSPYDGSLIEYLSSLLRMKILGVVPPLVVLPMVMPPSSFLLVQRFEANL
jgi:hypothetical protein